MEIHQKISVPDHQKLKKMGRGEKIRNFDYETLTPSHGRIESGVVVKNQKGLNWR